MKSKFSQMIKAIFAPTKRLMLVLSLLLTISAVYAGGGGSGSKTYYAKATVAVASESTGKGLVYVIDKDGTSFPTDAAAAATAETGQMEQADDANFSI